MAGLFHNELEIAQLPCRAKVGLIVDLVEDRDLDQAIGCENPLKRGDSFNLKVCLAGQNFVQSIEIIQKNG